MRDPAWRQDQTLQSTARLLVRQQPTGQTRHTHAEDSSKHSIHTTHQHSMLRSPIINIKLIMQIHVNVVLRTHVLGVSPAPFVPGPLSVVICNRCTTRASVLPHDENCVHLDSGAVHCELIVCCVNSCASQREVSVIWRMQMQHSSCRVCKLCFESLNRSPQTKAPVRYRIVTMTATSSHTARSSCAQLLCVHLRVGFQTVHVR